VHKVQILPYDAEIHVFSISFLKLCTSLPFRYITKPLHYNDKLFAHITPYDKMKTGTKVIKTNIIEIYNITHVLPSTSTIHSLGRTTYNNFL